MGCSTHFRGAAGRFARARGSSLWAKNYNANFTRRSMCSVVSKIPTLVGELPMQGFPEQQRSVGSSAMASLISSSLADECGQSVEAVESADELLQTPTSEEEGETKDARRHFKEGQKHVTPPQGDSTRGFYESLLEEKPGSVMAIRYCVEHGIFAGEKHRKLLARYNELKASGDLNPNKRALDRVAEKYGLASEESSAPSAKRRKTTKDDKKSSTAKVKKEKKKSKKSK
ncbi:hypothetical protein FOL47_008104 [Perkinsus chesapeaki]|uniref:Uncharacterized protein n=1 Tax=Perkinsus chesapeaki TaxID=330153 RepID=A0A7J6LG64_PERCH|nr:hypothetical protein FOL47_008104 [Perkinsus chesapeaki]